MTKITSTPITIILGAGFSAGIGLPTTSQLTDLIKGSAQHNPLVFQPRELDTNEIIWRMATGYYEQPNFETMLHLAESAMAYRQIEGWLSSSDRAKPAYGAFMNVMPHWSDVIEHGANYNFKAFIDRALGTIANTLVHAADAIDDKRLDRARLFFDELSREFSMAVATLNYDDIVERILPEWRDGFELVGDRYIFKPRSLLADAVMPTLLHLHGSVRWYRPINGEVGGPLEMFRAADAVLPGQPSRRDMQTIFSQSGDLIVFGPLISGLRKADKITAEPFATYHWKVRESLLRSPKVVIVGYAGWDSYLSNLIAEFQNAHDTDMRLAVVAYRPPGTPWEDNSVLQAARALGINDVMTWEPELERAFLDRTWIGNNLARVFVGGFPLDVEEIRALTNFLNS